jgi:hypothetical protein
MFVSFQLFHFLPDTEIVSFVPDEVISFFEFPDDISCPVNFTYTGFENKVVVDAGDGLGLYDRAESYAFVTEMPDDWQIVLFLFSFYQSLDCHGM